MLCLEGGKETTLLKLANVFLRTLWQGAMPSTEFFPKAKEAALRAIELDEHLAEAHAAPCNGLCENLDERAETFACLERAYEERDTKMVFLNVEPKWNNLRNDSRFQSLLQRVGFTA